MKDIFSVAVLLLLCIALGDAFMLKTTPSHAGTLKMSVLTIQESLFAKMDAQLSLKLTPNMEDKQTFTEGDCTGKCEWWEEKMGGKLTGVSKNVLKTGDLESITLNGWMGPGYSVPHFLLTVSSKGDSYSLQADLLARGPTPLGTGDYVDKFYDKDVIAWYDNSASKGELLPTSSSFSSRLLQSPVALSVGKLTLEAAADIANQLVDKWLGWIADKEGLGQKVESRSRGAMNARDDKQRQYAYKASMDYLTPLVGAAAAVDLAPAFTGPIAEAYVGGGS